MASLPSLLCCAAKRKVISSNLITSNYTNFSLSHFRAAKAFEGSTKRQLLTAENVSKSAPVLSFHTSTLSMSKSVDESDPPKTSIVEAETGGKDVDVANKEIAKIPEEPDRKVSTVSGKTWSKLTASYNNKQNLIKMPFVKPFEATYVANRPIDPINRALDHFRRAKNKKGNFLKDDFFAFYDVVIIGGGIIGQSVAYWLAQRIPGGINICVIERDPSYRSCSTTLSVGGVRQQFSLPENIQMSLFGADFLRNANRLLYVHGKSSPDVQFQPHGYLFLATEEGAEIMEENHKVQIECGAKVELLSAKRLKYKFPWLNTDGIALGSYGYENEGWFDPWSLLSALKIKNMDLGVTFIHGEVYNMAHKTITDRIFRDDEEAIDEKLRLKNQLIEVHVHLPDGDVFPINAPRFVIAAGADSGHVANLCGIGCGDGILQVPLPVEPRKRYVYNVHCPTGPGLDCPLVVDPTGTYFRREGLGNHYLCGRSPTEEEEPAIDNDDVDFDFYDDQVWPVIANRAKCFESSKVKSAWCGFYDYNTWDQNAIIGDHPYHSNLYFATGCSGHGLQQAPAIGRAIMELMLDDDFQTIDLTRFGYDRILNDIEMKERNIV